MALRTYLEEIEPSPAVLEELRRGLERYADLFAEQVRRGALVDWLLATLLSAFGLKRARAGPPTPVYYLTLSELAEGADLRQARLGGWRFPVTFDWKPVGALEVDLDEAFDSPTSASYIEPDSEDELDEAAVAADELEANKARLLLVPALSVAALWVQEAHEHEDDANALLLPLPRTRAETRVPSKPIRASEFIEQLRREAREQLERSRAERHRGEWDDIGA